MSREVNAAALAIAEESEGCVLTAYRDPAGVPTAGYGHTGPDVALGRSYTLEQALAWRAADMARAAAAVARSVKVPLNDNQFSALAEFTYNVGAGSLLGSTLLRRLNRGLYTAIPGELARWNRAGGKVLPGLVTRRVREAALFMTPPAPVMPAMAMADRSLCVSPRPAPSLAERLRAWLRRNTAPPV